MCNIKKAILNLLYATNATKVITKPKVSKLININPRSGYILNTVGTMEI